MLALVTHVVLMLVVLAGIAVRRRWRATIAFPLYLAVGCAHKVAQVVGAISPKNWAAWLLVELAQDVIVLCAAVEICGRIFHRGLAGGRAYTGRAVVAILLLGCLSALFWGRSLASTTSDHELYFALIEAGRRLTLTAAAAFTLVGLAVVSVFDWPLDPYHRNVAAGYLVWQWACVLLMPWPDTAAILPDVWPVWLYTGVLLWWGAAAWRPIDTLGLDREGQAFALPWLRGARG